MRHMTQPVAYGPMFTTTPYMWAGLSITRNTPEVGVTTAGSAPVYTDDAYTDDASVFEVKIFKIHMYMYVINKYVR